MVTSAFKSVMESEPYGPKIWGRQDGEDVDGGLSHGNTTQKTTIDMQTVQMSMSVN